MRVAITAAVTAVLLGAAAATRRVLRHEHELSFRCDTPGCAVTESYVPGRRRDVRAAYRRQRERPFRCVRHRFPERYLLPGSNPASREVLVVTVRDGRPYWIPEGGTGGIGFECGPGFYADAAEFPEGTRLVVTVRAEPHAP